MICNYFKRSAVLFVFFDFSNVASVVDDISEKIDIVIVMYFL